MRKSSLGTDPPTGLQTNKLSEQVEGTPVEIRAKLAEFLVAAPDRERHLHLGQVDRPLPGGRVRSAKQLKDFEQLPNLRVALEKRTIVSYFKENCTN